MFVSGSVVSFGEMRRVVARGVFNHCFNGEVCTGGDLHSVVDNFTLSLVHYRVLCDY